MSFGLGLVEMLIIAFVAVLLFGGLAAAVVVALTVARSSPTTPSRPDAAPCPKCKALIPLGKPSCGACGASLA